MQTDQETEEYEDVEMSFEKRQLLIRPPIFSIICSYCTANLAGWQK